MEGHTEVAIVFGIRSFEKFQKNQKGWNKMVFFWEWMNNAKNKADNVPLKPCPFCGKKPEISFSLTSIQFDPYYNKHIVDESMAIVCRTVGCPICDHRVTEQTRRLEYSEFSGSLERELSEYEPNMELFRKWNDRKG